MPGAGFRRKARIWRVPIVEMSVAPFATVKKALVSIPEFSPRVKNQSHVSKAAGTAEPSFTASLLEDLSRRPHAPADEEEIICNVGGLAYAAASDTVCNKLPPRNLLNLDHCHRLSPP
jgi:hypothetical protein